MNDRRFDALVEAYGGDVRRWPEAERADAQALIDAGGPEMRERLQQAVVLDRCLDLHEVEVASDALMAGIVASASDGEANAARPIEATLGARPRAPAHAASWSRWLWPGAGLAGVGLAGTLAGALVVSVVLRSGPSQRAIDWPERGTAFSELSADWSEE